jgi:hypothetical protein
MTVQQPFKAKPFNALMPSKPPADLDTILDTAGKVADDANIGSMVRPNDKAGQGTAPDSGVVIPSKAAKKTKDTPATPTTVWKRLTCDVPDYLLKELHQKALANGQTVKYEVLDALRKAKFTIEPEDLVQDGRRA